MNKLLNEEDHGGREEEHRKGKLVTWFHRQTCLKVEKCLTWKLDQERQVGNSSFGALARLLILN